MKTQVLNKIDELAFDLFNTVLETGDQDLTGTFLKDHVVFLGPKASVKARFIENQLNSRRLSGDLLNKTFYASFSDILNKNRTELLFDQILHYFTTYGQEVLTGTIDPGLVYIPGDKVSKNIPELKTKKSVPVYYIEALSKEALIDKCIGLLSGVALAENTMNKVFELLKLLNFDFSTVYDRDVRNKEFLILVADTYGIYPENAVEALRYVIYKVTESTLLIKSSAVLDSLRASNKDNMVKAVFKSIDEVKWAEIFNRFKPIFLAIKKGSAPEVKRLINRYSKLSKTYHKPMKVNVLNNITSEAFTDKEIMEALENSSIFQVTRAYKALDTRIKGQKHFSRRIRNGKVFYDENYVLKGSTDHWKRSRKLLRNFLISKLEGSVKGKTILVDEKVTLALPSTEKSFIGNLPIGTKFTGKSLNVGIYWENKWGARDLDLSSYDLSGNRLAWNSSFKDGKSMIFSGDVTNAQNGAVEYFRVGDITSPWGFSLNVFSGDSNSKYKIVLGEGSKVNKSFMMNPNKVSFECMAETGTSQSTFGFVYPEEDGTVSYVLALLTNGSRPVSNVNTYLLKSFYEEWVNAPSLNKILKKAGANLITKVKEDADEVDIDLRVKALQKDTILKLFS